MKLRILATKNLWLVRSPKMNMDGSFPEKSSQGYQLVYWNNETPKNRLSLNVMCGKCAGIWQGEEEDGIVDCAQENFYAKQCYGYCGRPLERYEEPLVGDTTLIINTSQF